MIVAREPSSNRLAIYVDKGVEGKWRSEPYYSDIKHFAKVCVKNKELLFVLEGKNQIVVFPDKEQFLGAVDEDSFVISRKIGEEFDAIVVDKDDPRAVAMLKQNKDKFG